MPDDLGAGTNESETFVGQWNQLVIGMRPDMSVRVQTDPYSQGANGLVVIRSYLRADVVLLDDAAFEIVDQILA